MDYLFRVADERPYMVEIGRLQRENQELRFHNFEKGQSICELNIRLSMLIEGKEKSVEEKIMIQEKYEKRLEFLKQEIKAFKEQKAEDVEVIHELNKRLGELGNEIWEKDRVLEMYAKMQGFKGDTEYFEKEIEVLKRQKSVGDQTISELHEILRKVNDEVLVKDRILGNYEEKLGLSKQEIKAFKEQKSKDVEVIHELNKRLSDLGNEIREKDRVLEMYAKVQGFKGNTEHFEKEIEVLKRQKSEGDQTISELHEIIRIINDEVVVKDRILGNYEEKLGLSKRESQVLKSRKVKEVEIIHELNKKLSKLKDEILDNDLALVTYENEVGLLKQNIQVLMSEKLTDNQMLDEMKCKLLAADTTIADMTCELSKASYERNMIISESNEKMGRLENQILEKVDKLECEIRDLKHEKMITDHMIEKIKSKQSKADDGVNKIISEWEEKTSMMKNQLLEKDETIGNYNKELKYYVEKWEQVKREARILKGQILRDDEMRSEHTKGTDEKNKMIAQFHEEIRKLKNQLLEKDQLEGEIKELKGEKFTVCQMIEKMKCDESKANHERKKIISGLSEKIGILENQTLEKDQVVEMYQKQLKCSNAKVEQLKIEMQVLKDQIISADQMIEKMKSKQVAVDLIMGKIKHGQSETHNAVEDLIRRNSEASKIVDRLSSQALVPSNEAGNCDVKIALSPMPKVLSTCTTTKRSRNCLQKKGSNAQQQEIEKYQKTGALSGNSVQAENGGLEREKNCKRLKSTVFIQVNDSKKLGEEPKICENDVPFLTQMDSDDEACDELTINELLAKIQMFKSK